MKAVLFDLDGVLVDATEWHYEALNKALNIFGHEIGRDDHIDVYNGLPTVEKLDIMTEKGILPEGLHGIIRTKKKQYTNQIIEEKCKPDLEKKDMLESLSDYRLACCSNAIKSSVLDMLRRAGIIDYFEVVMGNDEGAKPKPEPDIYLKTMEKMGLEPKDCLIVEDAPHGVEAGQRSGARTLAVKGYEQVNKELFKGLLC